MFLKGTEIAAYLTKLETAEVKVQEVDFVALKVDAATPAGVAQKAGPSHIKQDAKIEGAAQIAVGIKKEVDFAGWYTAVGWTFLFAQITKLKILRFERLSQKLNSSITIALVVAIF